jgi:hypothetical protein
VSIREGHLRCWNNIIRYDVIVDGAALSCESTLLCKVCLFVTQKQQAVPTLLCDCPDGMVSSNSGHCVSGKFNVGRTGPTSSLCTNAMSEIEGLT